MIQIRRLTAADVDSVLAIQEASPEAARWSRQAYETALADAARTGCLIATAEDAGKGNGAVAFACFRIVEREAELLNLAVAPAFRRLGVGSRLLERVAEEAAASGALSLFLEVRESNSVAQAFYRQRRWQFQARRAGYYSNPSEDALIFHLSLPSL